MASRKMKPSGKSTAGSKAFSESRKLFQLRRGGSKNHPFFWVLSSACEKAQRKSDCKHRQCSYLGGGFGKPIVDHCQSCSRRGNQLAFTSIGLSHQGQNG
jgi:hypothetical protein